MRATFNSIGAILVIGFVSFGGAGPMKTQAESEHRKGPAISDPEAKQRFADRAEQDYLTRKKQYREASNDPQLAWEFGRACFDWAEFARNDRQRERIAEEGIAACRAALAQQPGVAPAHYFLALNIGQLAQTKSVGALRLVRDMERELKLAIGADSRFDFAGPDRTLGLLYRDAPGWPLSIGSRSKSLEHLERAVELFPDYPDNLLSLLESHLKWNHRDEALKQLEALEKIVPRARKELRGERWEASWADWDTRLEAACEKLESRKKSGR